MPLAGAVSEQMTDARRQPIWLCVLAATAVFAICCAAPLLIFPKLPVIALIAIPTLLFAVVSSIAAYRLVKMRRAFNKRLRVLQQQCEKARQKAAKARRQSRLYDEFVAIGREWEATFDALPEGAFLFDARGR